MTLTDDEKEVILALAEYNINITDVSIALYIHRNTVVYRIGRIKLKTGLDARNFYDLIKLIEMAKEGDING